MTDSRSLTRIIQKVQPDEIYNLAAQSHVAVSFEEPEYTANSDALGALRILEAIRILGLEKKTRFYQASTSELYGLVQETPQKETTPFYPRSPMRWPSSMLTGSPSITAKPMASMPATAFCSITNRRYAAKPLSRARSPARLSRIKLGLQDCLYLGNLNSLRDWGHAKDYVEMQWLMLQQDKPEDFVIATGVQYSVRDFVNAAAKELDMVISWKGEGVEEKGYDVFRQMHRCRRSALLPSHRSRNLAGRCQQSQRTNSAGLPRSVSMNWSARWCAKTLKSAERDELVKKHGYTTFNYHE